MTEIVEGTGNVENVEEKAWYFLDEGGALHAFSAAERPDVPADWTQVDNPSQAAAEWFEPLDPIDFKLGMLTLNVVPDQVDEAIEQMSDPDRMIAKIYWTSAQKFHREDPLVEQIAAVFGKSAAEINGAWKYAEALAAPAQPL